VINISTTFKKRVIYEESYSPSLPLKHCNDVLIQNVMINSTKENAIGLAAINVLGTFALVRVKRIKITILYKGKENTNRSVVRSCKLNVSQFELIGNVLEFEYKIEKCKQKYPISLSNILSNTGILLDESYDFNTCILNDAEDISHGVTVDLHQSSYSVATNLRNSIFQQLYGNQVLSISIQSCKNSINNTILIVGCHFKDNSASINGLPMILLWSWICRSKPIEYFGEALVLIQNCSFTNNRYKSALVNIVHKEQ